VSGIGYCPTIKIRPGTEAIVQYAKTGDQTGDNVRYQQTITRTARECRYVGGQLTLKIGVAGRVAAGPKGGPGKIAVPPRSPGAPSSRPCSSPERSRRPPPTSQPNRPIHSPSATTTASP
jgi:hypothetical protein